MSVVLEILLGNWEWIAGGVVVLAAALGLRKSGADKAKRKQAERKVKDMKNAQEVQQDVQGMDNTRVSGELGRWMRDGDK